MTALAIFLLTVWASAAAGRTILQLLRFPDSATRLERNLIAYAIGLGLLAYGMLLLGLLRGLYTPAAWLWLLALFALGGRSHLQLIQDLRDQIRQRPRITWWGWGSALIFGFFALVSLLGDFTPPTLNEWDSIAYHLADPKLYMQAHRIYYLPWESHSNFAFTTEMWYLFGMMTGGVPLAKLFHFGCAVGACLAIYAFAARHLTPRIGLLAALIFAATPLVFWEAGTAYVDLTATFFSTLTLLTFANGMAARDKRWLLVSAILMGLTLSAKATSLTTLFLLALGVLLWQLLTLRQPLGKTAIMVAAWCLLALVVGSPWYIKSALYTGNPVYPFYSHLFGGRYWNAVNAAAYDASNANFGMGHQTFDALFVPWNLTMYLLPGHPMPNPVFRPFNDSQILVQVLSPLLLAALFFPAFSRGAPMAIKALAAFAVASFSLWFVTSQQVRYMLPLLPVLCLLTAWVLARAVAWRGLAGYALCGLATCSLAFSLLIGVLLVQLELPVILGQETRDAFISHGFSAYPAMQFINTQLPSDAKIVFYGNPLGFYCNRPYFWGDAQHSTFIPYDQFHSAADLRNYLLRMHVTHILVRFSGFDPSPGNDYPGWVYALTQGSGPPLFAQNGVALWPLRPVK